MDIDLHIDGIEDSLCAVSQLFVFKADALIPPAMHQHLVQLQDSTACCDLIGRPSAVGQPFGLLIKGGLDKRWRYPRGPKQWWRRTQRLSRRPAQRVDQNHLAIEGGVPWEELVLLQVMADVILRNQAMFSTPHLRERRTWSPGKGLFQILYFFPFTALATLLCGLSWQIQLRLTQSGEPWNQSPRSSWDPLKWSSEVWPGKFIFCIKPVTESCPRCPFDWMDLALRSQCQTVEFLSACFWTRIRSARVTSSFLDKRVKMPWSIKRVLGESISSESLWKYWLPPQVIPWSKY